MNQRWSRVAVPKAGWVRLRRSRALADWKSYRVTLDPAGRWHIAFGVIPARLPGPRRYDLIRIEDLRVSNMVRSARGTVDQPGRTVARKAGLNRSILNAAWTAFADRLEHKAAGRVERVRAAFTSQCCSVCRHVAAESGRAVTARGGPALAGPVNREPQRETSSVA